MAYGNAPGTVTRDYVRLLVGDISTSTSAEFLANGDYDAFISNTSNTYVAAQLAANSLAALFAGPSGVGEDWVERKVGDLTIKRSDASGLAKEFRALAQKFGRMAAAGISPYAGGLTISGKDEVEDDTDRVKPAFVRDLFSNPEAMDAARASTST